MANTQLLLMAVEINPIIPLSYNLADGRRKYVLFCGSGVSKDAGVSTGWEVLLETLRQVRAQEEGETAEYSNKEMEAYYEEKYRGLKYSEIIGSLFPSNEEQREFLENLFAGASPRDAHKLIAEWVKGGLIRFIITTNFDSLIEQALDDAGLRGRYSVISNGEQVLSSKPWDQVETCRIYKIHGTIEQGRILNTEKDLEELDEDISRDFLDLIERHGVIVLGYAGYDKDVMEIFNKRRFKGYTLYWTVHRNQVSSDVEDLVRRQDGLFINIESASGFLEEVIDRVEIARSGVKQTREAVSQVSFRRLITTSSDVEIRQTMDEEKKMLKKFIEEIINKVDKGDYNSLWEGYKKIFNYSMRFLLLTEQVIKYQEKYWSDILPVFEEIHSLNTNQTHYGKEGLINYSFFSLLEILGGILVENQAFSLMNEMLEIKRLDQRRERMEPILDWQTNAQFIEIKNNEEGKETRQKLIAPRMEYLRRLIDAQEIPFEFDLKTRILEGDLLYFVKSIQTPIGYFPYWYPTSSPYFQRLEIPDILKRIKLDETFGAKVANELFGVSYEELVKLLGKAKEAFNEMRQKSGLLSSVLISNPFEEF